MRPDVSHIGLAVDTGDGGSCRCCAAAVYVSPEVYSLPVYQEFASLRPPLGGRTRLVIIIIKCTDERRCHSITVAGALNNEKNLNFVVNLINIGFRDGQTSKDASVSEASCR